MKNFIFIVIALNLFWLAPSYAFVLQKGDQIRLSYGSEGAKIYVSHKGQAKTYPVKPSVENYSKEYHQLLSDVLMIQSALNAGESIGAVGFGRDKIRFMANMIRSELSKTAQEYLKTIEHEWQTDRMDYIECRDRSSKSAKPQSSNSSQ